MAKVSETEFVCAKCKERLPLVAAVHSVNRGRVYYTLCKSCHNERTKTYQRAKSIPNYAGHVAKLPTEVLQSQLRFLRQKMRILREEIERRSPP